MGTLSTDKLKLSLFLCNDCLYVFVWDDKKLCYLLNRFVFETNTYISCTCSMMSLFPEKLPFEACMLDFNLHFEPCERSYTLLGKIWLTQLSQPLRVQLKSLSCPFILFRLQKHGCRFPPLCWRDVFIYYPVRTTHYSVPAIITKYSKYHWRHSRW